MGKPHCSGASFQRRLRYEQGCREEERLVPRCHAASGDRRSPGKSSLKGSVSRTLSAMFVELLWVPYRSSTLESVCERTDILVASNQAISEIDSVSSAR